MPLIKVRDKNQVTLPREVVDFLHVQPTEHIEYKILPDGVLIRSLAQKAKEDKLAKIRRLSKSNRGVYSSAFDADAFINALRNESTASSPHEALRNAGKTLMPPFPCSVALHTGY